MKNKLRAKIISEAHYNSKNIIKALPCPIPGCGCSTIKSHTIQEKGILNNIAFNGEVYAYQQDYMDCIHFEKMQAQPRRFRKYKTKFASSFPAFCSAHDDILFSSIEKGNELKEGTIAQEKSLFLRAVMAEYCMQREAIIFESEVRKLNIEYGCIDYNVEYEEFRKEQFNLFIEPLLLSVLDDSCGSVFSKWYTIPYNMEFACTALVEIENNNSFFSINVLPVTSGETIIVFSTLDKYKGALRGTLHMGELMFGGIDNYALKCAFMNSMNVFVSPPYWESKSEKEKEQLLNLYLNFMMSA